MPRVLVRELGSLAVVETEVGEDPVQRELTKLNDRLVLSCNDVTEGGVHCRRWCVVMLMPTGPAEEIYVWQDASGMPLPLSMGLVDEVKQQIKRSEEGGLARAVADSYKQKREKMREETRQEFEDIARENLPRYLGQKKTVLHRGQDLRMARDRERRRRGEHEQR